MLVILLLLTISFPLLFLFICRNYYASKLYPRPPGPCGLPLIGNMHQFDSSNTHLYLFQLSQKYGPLVYLQLGSVPTLVVSSASAAKEVFKYHDQCFSSRPALVGTHKLSYNGLDLALAPYNEYWRNTRKLCTIHLFSFIRSQSFRPLREEEVARMVKTIHDKADTCADYNIVNLSKTVMTVASSIIFRIAFGKRYNEEEDDTWDNNGMSSKIHWLLTETQTNFASFFLTDYFPLLGCLIDRLSGARARLDENFNRLDEFYQQLIDEHMHASTVSTQESSILDILLQMKMDSSEFTFDHIKAILMNVVVAGTGTSSTAVVWAMTLLITNPFGAGRRICPGIAMGVATTELVLANLLYSFNWELPPGTKFADIDMATLPGLTAHKKNDLCLVPKIIS